MTAPRLAQRLADRARVVLFGTCYVCSAPLRSDDLGVCAGCSPYSGTGEVAS